jgi:large subunit ribosomal protein L19
VLVSGDHARVEAWRRAEAEALTLARRPDLWAAKIAQNVAPGLPKRHYKRVTTGRLWRIGPPNPSRRWIRDFRAARFRARRRWSFAMNIIQEIDKEQLEKLSAGKTIPEFGPGDTVIVNVKVKSKASARAFRPMRASASAVQWRRAFNESFTVRKISYGEGVERVFPIYSPMIDSIKLVRRGKVRRAKLYYLRGLRGKSARIVEKQDNREKESLKAASGE